jgi:hypothetical protein
VLTHYAKNTALKRNGKEKYLINNVDENCQRKKLFGKGIIRQIQNTVRA